MLFSYEHRLSPLINLLNVLATNAPYRPVDKRKTNTTTDGESPARKHWRGFPGRS